MMGALVDALVEILMVFAAIAAGVYSVAVLDRAISTTLSGVKGPNALVLPIYRLAILWSSPVNTTEAPDRPAWKLAPVLYLTFAAIGLALVPWSASVVPVDLSTGIVLWGAIEPLAMVAIFLHGWSANSHFALLGAYRYVSLGLSYILVSMFVLIGVSLPAESLQVSAVVASQHELWNVIRQPMGLPLFLIVGLGISFWGPLNFADSRDLAGGTSVEVSGRAQFLWQVGRAAMLVAFSAIGASAFLGGWLGPILPGPVWLILKTLFILFLLLLLGQLLPRLSPDRFLTFAWVVLLPLSFLDLAWAGLEALQ